MLMSKLGKGLGTPGITPFTQAVMLRVVHIAAAAKRLISTGA
jgi:hypothetical protein